MPRHGAVFHVGESISRRYNLPWTPEEDAKLSRAFIDLDLDGEKLHMWCRSHGIERSPGAIDRRLSDLNFFDVRPIEIQRYRNAGARAENTYTLELAKRNLANQIKLATIEAPHAPLFKPEEDFL